MAKIPVRFKRVADAFDKAARSRPCKDSSGSDHVEESMTDLSVLVDSFLERDEAEHENEREESKKFDRESYCSNSKTKETLQSLLGFNALHGEDEDVAVKTSIQDETELACLVIGNSSSDGFKRRLMSHLREKGFDAGLCKSRWEQTGRYPAGDYEYIDVKVAGTRYVVEISFSGEFTIARPTNSYLSLYEMLPAIFVGKPEEMKQVVRLMCAATKESLKSRDMYVPPWRRNGYLQAKWFGSYKRTTSEIPAGNAAAVLNEKRSVGGGEMSPAMFHYCRNEFGRKGGLKVGNLAAALNGTPL